MANHKRRKRRGSRACGLCKPHKKPGCRREKKTLQQKARKSYQEEIETEYLMEVYADLFRGS